jgi:hypothetical protein
VWFAYQALIKNGYEVKKAPEGQSLTDNWKESNAWKADLHIPIHTNGSGGKGVDVIARQEVLGNKYVQNVYEALCSAVPAGARTQMSYEDYKRINNSVLGEIENSEALCISCGCEFHGNAAYAAWIIANADEIGEAIARGVCKADGKNYIPLSIWDKVFIAPLKTTTSMLVKVNAASLPVRNEPGISSSITSTVTDRGTYTIVEVASKDQFDWGKLKSGAGWLLLNSNVVPYESYMVKVTADELNVRKGPGVNYQITGSIRDRGTYTIVEGSSGKGANKWGKLKSGAGWISLDFTQKASIV